jgi:hypothetical protein
VFAPPLVRADFEIPEYADADVQLVPLGLRWLREDYAAICDSCDHIDGKVTPPTGNSLRGFTIEDDLLEVAWHEREFRMRTSFAWMVMDTDRTRSLGCGYLFASPVPEEDAVGAAWGRWDPSDPGRDGRIYELFRSWVESAWPFEHVAWPGRTTPWNDWLSAVTTAS